MNDKNNYQILTENSQFSIVLLDLDGNIIDVNESSEQLFGYTREELIGKHLTFLSIYPSGFIKKTKKLFQSIINGEFIEPIEAQIYNKNRNLIWVSIIGFSIKIGEKKFLQVIFQDIEKKVLVDQKIKQSEKKYRELAELVPDIIFEEDLDYNLTFVNSIGLKKFGYTKKDLENGLNALQMVDPTELKRVKSNILKLLNGEKISPTEYLLVKKDGTQFHARINSSPIYRNKKIEGLRGVIHDITKTIDAEKKLKESEEKYRFISENANDAIIILNENFHITYLNEIIHKKLTGYSKSELLDRDFFEFIHPEDTSDAQNILKQSIESGEGIVELRFRHKDGTYQWNEIKGRKFINNEGEQNYLLISRDISERKLTEQKLKESEEKYRALIKTSPNLIYIFDHECTIIECNQLAEKYLGRPRERIINNKIYDLLSSLTKEKAITTLDHILSNIKQNNFEPIDFSYTDSHNNKTWYQLYYSLLNIGDKSYIHVELQDFTKLKEAEEIIKKENRRLIRLDKIRKNLIETTSHELKTPLTSIYGANQLLYELNKDKLSDESMELIEIARSGSENLKNIILNLLDVSLLESNKFKISKQDFNFVDIVRDCVKNMKYLYRKRGHRIDLNLPEELYLKVDKSSIERVLINLLSNAIKYTPPNGIITIKLNKEDMFAELSISDTGIGLTENDIKKLFKKFSVIKKSEAMGIELSKDGTGLGLYICKEIVELHNGQIWAVSEGKEKGSTFFIKLPLL
jgi:PAS domain S-box-containing protein